MSRPRKYPPKLLERVRLALESGRPIAHRPLRSRDPLQDAAERVRQAEEDRGFRPDLATSEEREEIKRLRQENFELRRANPATTAYIERRLQEGKTRREANPCLKRYLARSLYPLLEHGPPLPT